jgi:hypothetical protein
VSSVVEWVTAMGLMWKYAEATNNPRWKGMAWGMVPSLGSAMAAVSGWLAVGLPTLQLDAWEGTAAQGKRMHGRTRVENTNSCAWASAWHGTM